MTRQPDRVVNGHGAAPARLFPMALGLAAVAISFTCGGRQQTYPYVPHYQPPDTTEPVGLVLALRDGARASAEGAPRTVVSGTPLAAAAFDALIARLPDPRELAVEQFSFPAQSLAPPQPGTTVDRPLGEAESPDAVPDVASGALKIVRKAPVGPVDFAAYVSVTFNQPMVAVSSHGQVAAGDSPVRISPTPPGRWQWVGTKTIVFEPDTRFALNTRYSVSVPTSAKSAAGRSLDEVATWSFVTPERQVIETWPTADTPRELTPLMFARFDDAIEPGALVAGIRITAGGATMGARIARDDEIEADEQVAARVRVASAHDPDRRWVAFYPAQALPMASVVKVQLPRQAKAFDEQQRGKRDIGFEFETYGRFEVDDGGCHSRDDCRPGTAWWILFSNPIDPTSFTADAVTITPALSERKVVISDDFVYIEGSGRADTTYSVSIPAGLADVFGQSLSAPVTRSFHVDDSPPQLVGPSGMVIVQPMSNRASMSVFSIHHSQLKVTAYRVGTDHWGAYLGYMEHAASSKDPGDLPGEKLFVRTIDVAGTIDELVETKIDLTDGLVDGYGQLAVRVEPAHKTKATRYQRIDSWVQITDIGLDAFIDTTEVVGWATALSDGAPLSDVTMRVVPAGGTATTDSRGIATLALSDQEGELRYLLVASRGSDMALLPDGTDYWNGYGLWRKSEARAALRWYAMDDRGMYKPGETAHIKGWVRRFDPREGGDLSGIAEAATSVQYELIDPMGATVDRGTATLTATGGFGFEVDIPAASNTGWASIRLVAGKGDDLDGREHTHAIQIEEFRRPEFEVEVVAGPGPYHVGDTAELTATARYYTGSGLADAPVEWTITSMVGSYTPPNRSEYSFGSYQPFWRHGGTYTPPRTVSHVSTTDSTGAHHLEVDLVSADEPRAMTLTAVASVVDLNRQTWSAETTTVVHPSSVYVGVKSHATFVIKGEPIEVDGVAVGVDGELVERAVSMRAVRVDWTLEDGAYVETFEDEQLCARPSTEGPISCAFDTPRAGEYRIEATVVDTAGRRNRSEITVWVAGDDAAPDRGVGSERAELIPDKVEYAVGDTARLLVRSPFYPAEGVLTLRRSGVVHTETFHMDSSTHTVEIPVAGEHVPNLYVNVELVGARERPVRATAYHVLSIPPAGRRLSVELTPDSAQVAPGETARVAITVRDADGQPVPNAEVVIVAVDEAVLALSGYQLSDPMDVFYAPRPADTRDHHSRDYVQLPAPEQLIAGSIIMEDGRSGGLAGGGWRDISTGADMMDLSYKPPVDRLARFATKAGESLEVTTVPMVMGPTPKPAAGKQTAGNYRGSGGKVATRSNFAALAAFIPDLVTGDDGTVSAAIELPDTLTRYRIMAVAAAGEHRFGTGESTVTARLPLMVLPSAPRFLNYGDRFELPVVIHNGGDADVTIEVAARGANAEIGGHRGRTAVVPAHDRIEMRFAAAAARPGEALFQIIAATADHSDAAEVTVPVRTPASEEVFATYGTLDSGTVAQAVLRPSGVVSNFGGVEITTTSTQLHALTDAFVYLVDYPFECAEQISSRILAITALRDVLVAFDAEGRPPPEELRASLERDIARLRSMQHYDGGFSFWADGDESWPFVSAHVAHALGRAKAAGIDMPDQLVERAQDYLRDIRSHIPDWYGKQASKALQAYALYVRALFGDRDVSAAKKLAGDLDELSLEASAWLLAVLAVDTSSAKHVAAIIERFHNRVVETAESAHFASSYELGKHVMLASDRRTDAVILDALLAAQPDSELVPKLVAGLLAHRVRGRWQSTQENAFVLLGLRHYFDAHETDAPAIAARIWLGSQFAGAHQFEGRSTERQRVSIPMAQLPDEQTDVIVAREGTGRLYYRIAMRYATTGTVAPPVDRGFAVSRTYEPLDGENTVELSSDGTWKIALGSSVRVRVKMAVAARRYHVALVSPLAAGLEPMNPVFETTHVSRHDLDGGDSWRYAQSWFEHQNLRDDRAEAFVSLLWTGTYEYTFVARATTPGTFTAAAARAEEMYSPETFGRSATERIVIE